MLISAHDFVVGGVNDYMIARASQLEVLPPPDYLQVLEQQLHESSVQYIDIGLRIGSKKIETGYESWRIYRVRSFVWHNALFIIRDRFTETDFQAWPEQLREAWNHTMIDVPDMPLYL